MSQVLRTINISIFFYLLKNFSVKKCLKLLGHFSSINSSSSSLFDWSTIGDLRPELQSRKFSKSILHLDIYIFLCAFTRFFSFLRFYCSKVRLKALLWTLAFICRSQCSKIRKRLNFAFEGYCKNQKSEPLPLMINRT